MFPVAKSLRLAEAHCRQRKTMLANRGRATIQENLILRGQPQYKLRLPYL